MSHSHALAPVLRSIYLKRGKKERGGMQGVVLTFKDDKVLGPAAGKDAQSTSFPR